MRKEEKGKCLDDEKFSDRNIVKDCKDARIFGINVWMDEFGRIAGIQAFYIFKENNQIKLGNEHVIKTSATIIKKSSFLVEKDD